MGFPERLKKLREERGLSQEELALKLDIPRTSITHYENPKGEVRLPRGKRLESIVDFFGVTVDYLLGRSDEPSPSINKNEHNNYKKPLDSSYKLVARRLREARTRKGLQQNKVAEQLGIDNSTLAKYESGQREPDLSTLKQLATLYEVSIDWLAGMDAVSVPNQLNEIQNPDAEEVKEILNSLPENKRRELLDQMYIVAAGIVALEKKNKSL
ncbi:helix-turn-helix domain-containing protein [Brevibacillus laterosporus]|nr:helix-turn-helix transcriptional regulator [Brevibacillus laterosporus]TPG86837.1 helix-turn-helix domain-containing protein [Brevibacillus laterosporus]